VKSDKPLEDASVETRLIHGEQPLNSTSAVVPPIYQTATFRASSTEDFAARAGDPIATVRAQDQ
jgi:cystathionine beta-lyase/cystathionine gamma-synthase